MGLRADVRENVTQAPFAEEVDIEHERATEPGDADDLAAGSNNVERLADRLASREPLLGAPPRALEHNVGTDAPGEFSDSRYDISGLGIEGVVRSKLLGNRARLVADVDRDDDPRAADSGDLQAL